MILSGVSVFNHRWVGKSGPQSHHCLKTEEFELLAWYWAFQENWGYVSPSHAEDIPQPLGNLVSLLYPPFESKGTSETLGPGPAENLFGKIKLEE
ncbi:MAG: hypothetical protein Ct9H300mP14_08720 [Gammaproteobacteria bacterium]|nr:MAG: hypothetical protein Ct9H300mP14_08720 [Gammaproteobacteria bacterium]